MQCSQISLLPVNPLDYATIARLESAAFEHDAFSRVAFGPLRASEEALRQRVRSFERQAGRGERERERVRFVKAVVTGKGGEGGEGGNGEEEGQVSEGKGEIVGFAHWVFQMGRRGDEAVQDVDDVKEEESHAGRGSKEQETTDHDQASGWGPSANVQFCEDVFLPADEYMLQATKGEAYAKLHSLIVSPSHQRRGIGTLLLAEGLRVVDAENLQVVLGASPEAEGLYTRFGFVLVEVMSFRLSEYEGGEGLRGEECECKHVVMWRGAVGGAEGERDGRREE